GGTHQGVSRDEDAGSDGSAPVVTLRPDQIDRGGGAEVDRDDRRPVGSDGTQGVDDAVGTHLTGVVDPQLHSGTGPGTDDYRLVAGEPVQGGAQRHGGGGNHRRQRRPLESVTGPPEEGMQEQLPFVGGSTRLGGEPPRVPAAAVVHTD